MDDTGPALRQNIRAYSRLIHRYIIPQSSETAGDIRKFLVPRFFYGDNALCAEQLQQFSVKILRAGSDYDLIRRYSHSPVFVKILADSPAQDIQTVERNRFQKNRILP